MQPRSRRILLSIALLLAIAPLCSRAAVFHDQIEVPNADILSFSPDGAWLVASLPISVSAGDIGSLRASLEGDDEPKLCVYAFPSLAVRSCTPSGTFDGDSGPRRVSGAISWSPDSSTLSFGNGSIRTMVDGDIWQLDAESGNLTNLTEDDFSGQIPFDGVPDRAIDLDSDPSYSPDGKSIAFVRIEVNSSGSPIPTISKLDLTSGEIATIATLSRDPFQLPNGQVIWSSDSSKLWFTTTGSNDTTIGLWSATIDGSNVTEITTSASGISDELVLLDIDPSESYALVGLTRAYARFSPPYLARISLDTGAADLIAPSTSDAEIYLYAATFTTDGRLLVAEQMQGDSDTDDTVHLRSVDPDTNASSLLGRDLPPLNFTPVGPGLTVLSADLIAYPTDGDDDTAPWAVVSLSGLDPIPTTPESGNLQPGTTVVTTQETALRTTPSITGALSLSLSAGAELIVIDAPVEVEGNLWCPVREPESGALGYIQAVLIQLPPE